MPQKANTNNLDDHSHQKGNSQIRKPAVTGRCDSCTSENVSPPTTGRQKGQ